MPAFTNSSGITFADNTTITQTVAVSGFTGPITRISVSFTGLSHTFPDDLDFLLVGPDGTHNLLFWSDAGTDLDITDAAFTIADSASAPLIDEAQLLAGTAYQPADYLGNSGVENDTDFGSATGVINHATTLGAATFASAFNGIDPNGTWTLHARDDAGQDTGSLASWTLAIVTANDLEIDGTAGNDTLVVTATGPNSGSYVLNGAGAVAFSGITSLRFNGLGSDDTLTINNPSVGVLAIPIAYDGGGQSGDALEILGGSAGATTYTVSGTSSGTIAGTTTEVQHLAVSGGSGSFTLSFNGQTTPSLAFNASIFAVRDALNALSSIGAGGSVGVTGSGGNYDITFGGSLANINVPQLTAAAGGAAIVSINTAVQGGRTQTIDFTGLAPVTDTVSEATFTIVGTAGADTITITDGGIVGGDQTWLISSPTFESVRVSNKTTLIIDGNGGGDTVSMDTSVAPTGLLSLQIRGVASVSETGAFLVQNLTVDATNSVSLGNLNIVDNFSAHVTNAGGAVQFHDVSNLTVNGITTNGGEVTLVTDNAILVVGTAAANSGIDTGAAGNTVRLQAASGDIFQGANGAIRADFIGAFAAGSANLAGATNDSVLIAIAANGAVNYRDANDVTVSALAANGLFTANVFGVSSSNHDINLQVGGDLQLADGVPAAAIDAGTADVRIVTGGGFEQVNPDDRIAGDEVGIIAGGAVLLAAGNNAVNTLAISSAGLVEFRDSTGILTIGAVAAGGIGFTGASGITSGNNDVNLRTQSNMFLASDINAGSGDIRLVSDAGALSEGAGRLLGDQVGIIAFAGVAATQNNDANVLAISSPGAVTYHDADDLIIGTVVASGLIGFTGAAGVTGSFVDISTSSPLTVASNVASASNITLQAGDSAAAGDDLTVNGGVTVQATGNVALRAGDNLNLLAGSSIVAGGFVQGVVDFGNADAGTGATANLGGSIAAPGVHAFLGLDDGDTFFSAAGADTFFGLAGNDRFVWDPGDGSDTIDGGADIDTLAFNGSVASEAFSLAPSGANAIFTRNVGSITMTMVAVERLELAAGNGANLFTVADMSATVLTGLISYTGGSGIDTIGAAAAVNPFDVSAGAGNDQVATGAAADRVRGEAGDDFLNGGLGDDTAVYAGNVGDYQIAFLPGNDIRISDLRAAAPEGADTLRGIENAEFADATLSFLFGTTGDDDFVASGNQAIVAGLGSDTIRFDFRLVDATVTYAGHSVLIESGASHTVVSGFDTYVFTDGIVHNQDADVLVDDLFYYARNHDVWNAQAEADQHYHQFGRHEGRDPNAFFSTTIYLAANADVQAAGVDPLIHFDQAGWKEGRVPSLGFDPRQYLAPNPDVAAAQVDPLAHFLAFGAQEGRLPFAPTELVTGNGFDFVFYLRHNPDVAAANVDSFRHFQTLGRLEGRNPSALFDTSGYLAAYADVAAAHVNPLDHYDQFGRFEGRDPSVGFDTTAYLAANPDVAAAGVNPLVHFLQFGIHEGRSPLADGIFG